MDIPVGLNINIGDCYGNDTELYDCQYSAEADAYGNIWVWIDIDVAREIVRRYDEEFGEE